MSTPPGYSGSQHVTATGGFAYGVIGADIHVFGDGVPVYLLENWRGVPETDPAWLRELPSRMLNARFAVVDFTGRQSELQQLHDWGQAGPRLAARWLHGAGGAGKTRLAAQFGAELAAAGWKVITAIHAPGSVSLPPGSQDLRLDGTAGLLMIVDYADRWPHSHLTWLFSNAILHQPGVRTRVLLIARTGDAWPALRGALANYQAGTSSQELEPLLDSDGHRDEMFSAARDSFAGCYQLDAPEAVHPPDRLNEPDMGLTLALHMAALVAVDAHVEGVRPPTDMAGLTIYLLDREHNHWATLYGDPSHTLDPQPTYRTSHETMNQTVFIAALTGPVPRQVGVNRVREVFRPVPVAPEQVFADHAVCYPPANCDQDTVLEPLYPDRLAEDFIALTIPGHDADYPAQEWAIETVKALLERASDRTYPLYVARAITFLTSAVDRWPHVGSQCLYPLLSSDPYLAVESGGTVLSMLARQQTPTSILENVWQGFPSGRRIDLDCGMADIAQRLFSLLQQADPESLNFRLLRSELSARLRHAGRRDESLVAAQSMVLAARQPGQREKDLAYALGELHEALGRLGRWQEAISVAEEAEGIRRRLAYPKTEPTAPSPAANRSRLSRLKSWLS